MRRTAKRGLPAAPLRANRANVKPDTLPGRLHGRRVLAPPSPWALHPLYRLMSLGGYRPRVERKECRAGRGPMPLPSPGSAARRRCRLRAARTRRPIGRPGSPCPPYSPAVLARIMASIAARIGSGRDGHARATHAKSGVSRSKKASKSTSIGPASSEVFAISPVTDSSQRTENPCVAGSIPALPSPLLP